MPAAPSSSASITIIPTACQCEAVIDRSGCSCVSRSSVSCTLQITIWLSEAPNGQACVYLDMYLFIYNTSAAVKSMDIDVNEYRNRPCCFAPSSVAFSFFEREDLLKMEERGADLGARCNGYGKDATTKVSRDGSEWCDLQMFCYCDPAHSKDLVEGRIGTA